jgi:MFS family permease
MIGAAFGLGFIIGPAIGGELGYINIRLPFWFAAGLALLNFAYGLFVLPESHPKERRSPKFDWAHANPLGSLKLLGRYRAIWGLAGVIFLINLAHYVYPSVFVLFADFAYGWDERAVGRVLGVVGVLSVIVNALLVKRVVAKFGERRALLIGLACGVVGFTIYGFAPTGIWFLAGMPIMSLWALAMPSTQALVSRQVGPEVQGPHPGCADESCEPGGDHRAGALHDGVRDVHRRPCAGEVAGRAVPAGGDAARDGSDGGVAFRARAEGRHAHGACAHHRKRGLIGRVSARARYLSRIATTPMPPAVQIDTRHRPPPRCFNSFAAVATMRAPVAANGCPAASDEPFGLIFAGSMRPIGASRPRRLRQ